MTVARAARLDALGLAWGLSAAAISKLKSEASRDDAGWERWLAKLEAYKCKHGHCNVPWSLAEDPKLGSWVTTQRHSKRKLDRGDRSPMITVVRMAKLEVLGFNWAPGKCLALVASSP
jgi:hypothetical protein